MKKTKKKNLDSYAYGGMANPTAATGVASSVGATGNTGGGAGYGQLLQALPQIADGVISLIENNPNRLSKQPLINASAARTMVSPYKAAMGGIVTIDDILDNGGKRKRKGGTTTQGNYGTTGIMTENGPKSNPTDIEALVNVANYLQNNWSDQSETPSNVYRKEFEHEAVNTLPEFPIAAKAAVNKIDTAAYGGIMGANVNAEGNEVIETPNGDVSKIVGPKHESGGVDLNLPEGTKIFSDRLKIDGKTMQQRKLRRERSMSKINSMLETNPTDQLTKNSKRRTEQINSVEERNDMALQQIVNKIYGQPKQKAAYGGIASDPLYPNYFGINFGDTALNYNNGIPYSNGPQPVAKPGMNTPGFTGTVSGYNGPNTKVTPLISSTSAAKGSSSGTGFSTGDYVGIAGNLFNAIAPIVNTKKNWDVTIPAKNEFLGYGHKALDTNLATEHYVDEMRSHAFTDIDEQANTSIARNRDSAESVSTQRALNIGSDMGRNKAKASVDDNFSRQMMSILNERAGLFNQADAAQMGGSERAADKNEKKIDNYFSNMAENLVNAGTNVQGLGKSLNVSKSNKDDLNLLSQLSQYGLGFDSNGNLISTNKK